MATYLLEGAASARLPRRPLTVALSLQGPQAGVRLVARLDDSLAEAPGVRRHSAGMLIVPRVEEQIVIAAVPEAGRERFDPNTVLYVSIGLDAVGDVDSDVAQLSPRDVSGLASIELASIAPAGVDEVVVTTRLIQRDDELPPLATRARIACRGVLGLDRLPSAEQVAIGCVVDTSASMSSLVADGSVAAAADVIAGISAVVSGAKPVNVVLADERRTAVPAGRSGELATRIGSAIEQVGYGVGADLDAAVDALAGVAGLTVVVTDAPGPTLRNSARGNITRLVLSQSRSAVGYLGFTGALLSPPPPGAHAAEYLMANPQLLDGIVAGILTPIRGR